MSIVCILQRKRTWLCPHCPSPSVLTRENLQAKLRQKVRLCYMTVSSALSRTEWATVERLCEIAYVCRKRDNLVLAGSKWLIMLCIVFWGNGGVESSHRPKTRGSFLAKFRNAADCTGRNDKVNKYRRDQLTEWRRRSQPQITFKNSDIFQSCSHTCLLSHNRSTLSVGFTFFLIICL